MTLKNNVKFSFPDWDAIVRLSEYKKSYQEIRQLYEGNKTFKNDARTITRKVLLVKFKDVKDIERAVDEAVLYLLEELAFVFTLPMICNEKVTYLYHQPWPIYEKIISGKYDGKKRRNAFMLTGIK